MTDVDEIQEEGFFEKCDRMYEEDRDRRITSIPPGELRLNYSNGLQSHDSNRVKVAYYEATEKLLVVRTCDGMILREELYRFDLVDFIRKIQKYDQICNHK